MEISKVDVLEVPCVIPVDISVSKVLKPVLMAYQQYGLSIVYICIINLCFQ